MFGGKEEKHVVKTNITQEGLVLNLIGFEGLICQINLVVVVFLLFLYFVSIVIVVIVVVFVVIVIVT